MHSERTEAQVVVQEEAEEIDFRYKAGRDKPSDVRNVLLTVAVLLAAATYQAVYNPPGGLWQDNGGPTATGIQQVAGLSILATRSKRSFILFIFGNTVGFLFSMGMIDDLTRGFTRQWKLNVSISFICFTYGICVFVITPSEYQYWMAAVYYVALAIFVIVSYTKEGASFCARCCG